MNNDKTKFELVERKLQVALFTENGRFADDDCNHGTFIAWKDGVPA